MLGREVSHYRIESQLGAGGMGVVYLAHDTKLRRKVAIKFLPEKYLNDPKRRQRFLSEARAASALNHPHVCVIHEVNETPEGVPFIVMEHIQGTPLDRWMRRQSSGVREWLDIGIQMAEALEAAWEKGIVHRDIKPGNIVLNEKARLKVLDFGLARMESFSTSVGSDSVTQLETQPGKVVGTPQYMSPEQALGRTLNHQSDLFSMGIVLYELVAGRAPFKGRNFNEIINQIVNAQPSALSRMQDNVPPELERIVSKCLEKDLEFRYQNPRDLLADLRKLKRVIDASTMGTAPDLSPGQARTRPAHADAQNQEAGASTPPTAEVIAKSDIFINCSQIDDRALHAERRGWVSEFQKHLELRIEQLSGERVNICQYAMPSGKPPVDEQFYATLPSAKTMVSIVSPPFMKNEGCRKEVESFWDRADQTGGRWINNRSRLFQVVRTPVGRDEMPGNLSELFRQLLSFEFYDLDPQTGRIREYDESFGPAAKQRYYERIYDLSQEVCRVLKDLRERRAGLASAPGTGKTIYLAVASSDLKEEWERLKRELEERGHAVIPDRPLPLTGPEFHAAVRDYLSRCDCAVHLIGSRYGFIPEEADLSAVELQNRLAAEMSDSGSARRFIWMPRTLAPSDNRQQSFIRSILEEEESQRGAEIIQDNLENFKSLLLDFLQPKPEAPLSVAGKGETNSGPPKVYLIFDSRDEDAVEALEDYLFERGFEILTPNLEGDEAEIGKMHRHNLTICDAVLVYYGSSARSWVEMKLMDILQAPGYGRENPFLAKAVYVGGPPDRRKERFRSHVAEVLKASDAFQPKLLESFVTVIMQAANPSS